MDDTESGTKVPPEGRTEKEQPTSSVSRRVFLGAAAALSTMAMGAAGTVAGESGSAESSEENVDAEPVPIQTVGGIQIWDGAMFSTTVEVSAFPESVELELSNEQGRMHVSLMPEDVDELCRQLMSAKHDLVPAEVAHTREWIDAEYRREEEA